MTDDETTRAIELEIEVPGPPEEVWRAIATGPGISAWFVATEVDERAGGTIRQDFGTGAPVEGHVTRWEPPLAFAFTGQDPNQPSPLAFEFLVEAREGGSCIVRLVNSGFGTGEEWDGQYDGMTEGWKLFLYLLKLHLTHFAGQTCTPVLAFGMTAGPRDVAWKALTGALGLPAEPKPGDRVVTSADGAPPLAGTVQPFDGPNIVLLTESPTPGLATISADSQGDLVFVSMFGYFYGPGAPAASSWTGWMGEHFPIPAG
jgi:uncharacterized protein YndB with AHSA1/START domain